MSIILKVYRMIVSSVSIVGSMIKSFIIKRIDRFKAPDEIVNFNARTRNQWVMSKAKQLAPGSRVLDAGAGECQYRVLFQHCDYKAQDFTAYAGTSFGSLLEKWEYGAIDYVCDITDIPVPDGSFDFIVCTEVLEHVPFPIETIRELSRVLSSNGTLLLTAPLSSGLHQQPFHFYGGYSPHFYKKFLAECGLVIEEIKPIGGLMKHVAQEVLRVGRIIEERSPDKISLLMYYVLMCWLPKFLAKIDEGIFVEEFTVGYLVEARKRLV